MKDLAAQAVEAASCQGCRLAETRKNVVFGEGSETSTVFFVGEGPGAFEDETGRPFVGPAGQLLTKILDSGGFSRKDIYIGNIVKCRPPGNRDPKPAEMQVCEHWLLDQIKTIKPSIIVAMGNVAQRYFLGQDNPGITRVRGKFFPWRDNIEVFPIFHPSYLLRNDSRHKGGPKWLTWQDMKTLRARVDDLGT